MKPKRALTKEYLAWLIKDWVGSGFTYEDLAEDIMKVKEEEEA